MHKVHFSIVPTIAMTMLIYRTFYTCLIAFCAGNGRIVYTQHFVLTSHDLISFFRNDKRAFLVRAIISTLRGLSDLYLRVCLENEEKTYVHEMEKRPHSKYCATFPSLDEFVFTFLPLDAPIRMNGNDINKGKTSFSHLKSDGCQPDRFEVCVFCPE